MSSETEVSKLSAAASARQYASPKVVQTSNQKRASGQSLVHNNNNNHNKNGGSDPRSAEVNSQSSIGEHWKSSVRELVVCVGPRGILQLPVLGGSDNGEFCYLGNNVPDSLEYLNRTERNGARIVGLKPGDVLLEIQDQKVAGYTRRDVLAWLNHSCRCGNYVKIIVAESGLLTTNLRQFLNNRFVKGSPDHDLQNTIRDNLYLRTVPCTTRPRRDGEVDGVDYTFLSLNEFLSLESSGNLLESGIYEGNHYGTPKPPNENHIHSLKGPVLANGLAPSPLPSLISSPHVSVSVSASEVLLPGAYPSSEGKRRRNRSNVEAMASKFVDHDEQPSPDSSSAIPSSILNGDKSKPGGGPEVFGLAASPLELGTLPDNWEKAYTEEGEPYFINHTSGCSQWLDPRLARIQKKAIEDCDEDELPYGWEKIDDPQFGTYYIDHINRKTQYENPVLQAKHAKLQLNESSLPKPVFTKNPAELRGPLMTTTLIKSPRGFGFTIVGGDDHAEEFLQIKSVIHNGPAFQNGKLVQGDVLVYINDSCVLGYTHMDVVNVFQNIPVGEAVTLKVCRGYPLTFDVDDPHNEIVTTLAVTAPDGQSIGRADSEPSDGTTATNDALCYANNERGPPEVLTVGIVKGLMGFGFTIADSANGQKVKKILDRPRCKNVMEGDIMLEINSQDVRGLEHAQVVQYLKDCPQGQEAIITVQRGGTVLSNHKSRPKSAMATETDVTNEPKSDQPDQLYNPNVSMPGGPYRSKTPTCDVYGVCEREVFPNRSKTPLIDTRNLNMSESNGRPKTPASIGDLSLRENVRPATIGDTLDVSNSIYQKVPVVPDRWTQVGSNDLHQVEIRKFHQQPEEAQYGCTQQKANYFAGRGVTPIANAVNNRMVHNQADQFYHVGDGNRHFSSPVDVKQREDYYNRNECFNNQNAIMSHQRSAMSDSGLIEGDSDCLPSNAVYYDGISPGSYGLYHRHQSNAANGSYSTRNGHFDSELTYAACDSLRKEGTSFEHEQPSPVSQSARMPYLERPSGSWYGVYQRPLMPVSRIPDFIESTMTLYRQENGFGFRIIGGTEEGSQVSIGHIVPGGAADLDGRLRSGDEITTVDGISVLHTSHHHVVQLMGSAAASGRVTLGVRRRIQHQDNAAFMKPSDSSYPYDVGVVRRENEGFGFVIISSITKSGSTIGRIIDNSPAQRCNRLHVGDRILAVNGIDISNVHHGDIVNLIKDSGFTVTLTIGAPQDDASSTASLSQREESTLDEELYFSVELLKGTRGFGFSIRGGKEFHNMPLFVLRIADSGPAAEDGRLQIGDQIIQINGINTKNMTHSEAIEIIKHGGSLVRILVKRVNRPLHSKDRYVMTQNISTASLGGGGGEFSMPPFTSKMGGPIGQSSPQVALTSDSNAYTWEFERGPV